MGCRFVDNTATTGGGRYTLAQDPFATTMVHCELVGNDADWGGGAYLQSFVTWPEVVGCTFRENGGHLGPGSPCIDAGDDTVVPADSLDLDGDGDELEPPPLDLAGAPRFVDDPQVADTGHGRPPFVDMGAYERQAP